MTPRFYNGDASNLDNCKFNAHVANPEFEASAIIKNIEPTLKFSSIAKITTAKDLAVDCYILQQLRHRS